MGGVKVYSTQTEISAGDFTGDRDYVNKNGIYIYFYENTDCTGNLKKIDISEKSNESGPTFNIYAGDSFEIVSTKGPIAYIFMSFSNGSAGSKDQGTPNMSVVDSSVDGNWGSADVPTKKAKSNGEWTPRSDTPWGQHRIRFKVNSNQVRILWFRIYHGGDASGITINGGPRFENSTTASITGSGTIYWTFDNAEPTNSSTYTGGKSVDHSTVVRAYNISSEEHNFGKSATWPKDLTYKIKRSVANETSKVFTRYYKGPVKGPAGTNEYYGTLCYPYAVKVPDGCLAAPCVYANGATTFGTIYQAGEFIPASTPVVVYSASSGDKEFDWINTYNKTPDHVESPSASPASNSLEGNNGSSMPAEDSNYMYYGLMEPTAAQAAAPRNLKFGFYLFNYQGTRGSIPAYKAYLKVKRSDVKASSKEGFSLDFGAFVNNTTGISVVPATLDGASGRQVHSAVRYNLSGQQVGPGYKGIVIVNGRKMVVK